MNPPLTFTNAKTQLNILTSQTANFTFTDDEITQALTFAWADTYVVSPVWDNTVSFVVGTWQYALPATVTMVQGLYFQRTSTNDPELIGSNLYSVVNGQLQFNDGIRRWLDDTYTLYIKGRYKLTTSDSLPSANLINYVLHLAAEQLLVNLILKKAFVFLRNDTSSQEIAQALNLIQNRVLTYKQSLLREFEDV